MNKETKKLLKRAFLAGAEAAMNRHESPTKFKEARDVHPYLKQCYHDFLAQIELENNMDEDGPRNNDGKQILID